MEIMTILEIETALVVLAEGFEYMAKQFCRREPLDAANEIRECLRSGTNSEKYFRLFGWKE